MVKREELTNPGSCMNRAKEDEMTFVLLGRDPAAPAAIRAWIDERIKLGRNTHSDAQIIEASTCADRMEADNCLHPPKGLGCSPHETGAVHPHKNNTWWFWDETWCNEIGPYPTEQAANTALAEYAEEL